MTMEVLMRLGDLKEMMLLPDEEIRLQKTITIKGNLVHLMCITKSGDTNVLWAIYENKNAINNMNVLRRDPMKMTNRDLLLESVKSQNSYTNIQITKLIIQGQEFTVASSSSSMLIAHDLQNMIRLQHLEESKLLPDFLMEVPCENLSLARYTQIKGEICPSIDVKKELDITIELGIDHHTYLINQEFTLGFDEIKKNEFSVFNPLHANESTYYIQPLKTYDIWYEFEHKFEDKKYKDIPKDVLDKMSKESLRNLESICPKEKQMVILEYESEESVTLNFYATEYLDAIHQETNSVTVMMLRPDKRIGDHGMYNKVSLIKPISENDHNDIDIELFSITVMTPKEIIKT